jgi:hypothetical protein
VAGHIEIAAMRGLDILARTMTVPRVRKKGTPAWQYHPRSDHHSKVACWGILFDLLLSSALMRDHARTGRIAFGINHEMRNFTNSRKKRLDLVVCRPASVLPAEDGDFRSLVATYAIELSASDRAELDSLPGVPIRPVGSVLIALEAKAAMTEFAKARPRLFGELQDSHVTIHGDTNDAVAVGFAMVNGAPTFLSPTRNPCVAYGAPKHVSRHQQPRQLELTLETIGQLPRRNATNVPGFDALCGVAVYCENDGTTPVRIITDPPAVAPRDVLHYDVMIDRITGIYASRFPSG